MTISVFNFYYFGVIFFKRMKQTFIAYLLLVGTLLISCKKNSIPGNYYGTYNYSYTAPGDIVQNSSTETAVVTLNGSQLKINIAGDIYNAPLNGTTFSELNTLSGVQVSTSGTIDGKTLNLTYSELDGALSSNLSISFSGSKVE